MTENTPVSVVTVIVPASVRTRSDPSQPSPPIGRLEGTALVCPGERVFPGSGQLVILQI
jgi:hypothetical protein